MTLSLRSQRAFQALILVALGLFLLNKIWSGTLFWYISQRFLILVLAAGLGCLALAQSLFALRRKESFHPETPHPHSHEAAHLSIWTLFIVALPVLLGVLVPARPLGSTAMANKGINTSPPLTTGASQPIPLDIISTERTVLDWVRAFNYESDPSVYDGQLADVIGFVYHDDRLADDQFLVGRLAVTCCVADAMALGMIAAWSEAADLPANSWVRVRGPVEAAMIGGRPIPLILAEAVETVAEPAQPYLYP